MKHGAPSLPELLATEKHFAFESPTTPRYPDRQLPQVLMVAKQLDLCKAVQIGDAVQSTIEIVEDTKLIVEKVLSKFSDERDLPSSDFRYMLGSTAVLVTIVTGAEAFAVPP